MFDVEFKQEHSDSYWTSTRVCMVYNSHMRCALEVSPLILILFLLPVSKIWGMGNYNLNYGMF